MPHLHCQEAEWMSGAHAESIHMGAQQSYPVTSNSKDVYYHSNAYCTNEICVVVNLFIEVRIIMLKIICLLF